jgi:hypothetical protein
VPIDHTETYTADPDAVLAVLSEESFLRERAAALGAPVESLTVTPGPTTEMRLLVPTAGIPPLFARFVGSQVSADERQAWSTDGAGGHRAELDVRAEVFGRTVRFRGERRLLPVDGGTRSTVTGEAKVKAPLIGAQAAAAVVELVQMVLRREDELLRRRFTGTGT